MSFSDRYTIHKLSINDEYEANKDLDKLEGKPPYDGGSNICRGDGYFYNSIEKKFGMTIPELRKALGR